MLNNGLLIVFPHMINCFLSAPLCFNAAPPGSHCPLRIATTLCRAGEGNVPWRWKSAITPDFTMFLFQTVVRGGRGQDNDQFKKFCLSHQPEHEMQFEQFDHEQNDRMRFAPATC